MLDFDALRNGQVTMTEFSGRLTRQDLIALTNEMVDLERAAIEGVADADVTFDPVDPKANDTFGKLEEATMPWNLGHVVVHLTASAEEGAMRALSLARGVMMEGRSRYETPWREIVSAVQCFERLEESRRMCLAMLDAWPDQPHLDVTIPHARWGAQNAIAAYLGGMMHAQSHLNQLKEILAQAKAARTAPTPTA